MMGTTPVETCTNLPFGDAQSCTGTSVTPIHFTGKQRDTETDNDYFGARYYISRQGRWLTPDWSSRGEAVPYATLTNPQTLNLYAYVGNNPVSTADADGHFPGFLIGVWIHRETVVVPLDPSGVGLFSEWALPGGDMPVGQAVASSGTLTSARETANAAANALAAPQQQQTTTNEQQGAAEYNAFISAAKMPVDTSRVMLVTNVKTDVPATLFGPSADVTLTVSDAKTLQPVKETPKQIQAVEYAFQGSGGPSSSQRNSKTFTDTISAGSTKGGVIGQIFIVDGKRVATAVRTQAGTVTVSNINVIRTSPTAVIYNGFTLAQRPQAP